MPASRFPIDFSFETALRAALGLADQMDFIPLRRANPLTVTRFNSVAVSPAPTPLVKSGLYQKRYAPRSGSTQKAFETTIGTTHGVTVAPCRFKFQPDQLSDQTAGSVIWLVAKPQG